MSVSVTPKQAWRHHRNFHVGISMGSRNHTGSAFAAVVGWINDQGFDFGLLDVSDTLNRHNDNEHEGDLRARFAAANGVRWRRDNAAALKGLTTPHRIVHWNQWLSDPRFAAYKAQFETAFNEQPAFRDAVTKDITNFLKRKYGTDVHEISPADMATGKRYYLEELAVLSIQFENFPCVKLYPGKELESMKVIRAGKVRNIPTGIQNTTFARLFVKSDEPEALRQAALG